MFVVCGVWFVVCGVWFVVSGLCCLVCGFGIFLHMTLFYFIVGIRETSFSLIKKRNKKF